MFAQIDVLTHSIVLSVTNLKQRIEHFLSGHDEVNVSINGTVSWRGKNYDVPECFAIRTIREWLLTKLAP